MESIPTKWTTRAAALLAAVALIYSVLVAVTGQTWLFEGSDGSGEVTESDLILLIPVAASAILIQGVLRGNRRQVWLAATLTTVLAILFVFSLGIAMAPAALLLLAAAAVSSPKRWVDSMNRDQLFVGVVDWLAGVVAKARPPELLIASGQMRLLLLDQKPLFHQVNKNRKFDIRHRPLLTD